MKSTEEPHIINIKEIANNEEEVPASKNPNKRKASIFLSQLFAYFKGTRPLPVVHNNLRVDSTDVVLLISEQEKKIKSIISRIKESKILKDTDPPPIDFIETLSFENNDEDHIYEVVMEYLKERNSTNKHRQPIFNKIVKLNIDGEEGEIASNKTECFICLEQRPVFDFEEIEICGHKFCFNCIRDYLKECIYSPKILEIRCPNHECTRPILTEQEIEVIAPPLLFDKYKRLKLGKTVSLNPSLRWCIRPGKLFIRIQIQVY